MPTLQLHQTTATFAATSANIDERQGVIKGVSVISEGEAKGHGVFIDAKTLETTLAAAKAHPEGVPVKMDHGTGLHDLVGTLHNFRIDGTQLRADLRLLMRHPRFDSLIELARRAPAASGLSISFKYVAEKLGEKEFVRVTTLFSVDWVDAPAANPTGLFSVGQIDDEKLTALAVYMWGERQVQAWRGPEFSTRLKRRFVYSGLSVPGLNPAPITAQYGAPKQFTGFARVSRGIEQNKINQFFNPPAAKAPQAKIPDNVRGLERVEAAFALSARK